MTPPNLTESAYPISFREKDAAALGSHLKLRHSVELVGMKRVGISNFLRFFLYHQNIASTYISKSEKHIFIPVDLNDLVERELRPFWILTLKRLADITEDSKMSEDIKQKISAIFLQSIQLQDNFLTIENIKKALLLLISQGFVPTIFFLRFDRIRKAANPEFINNIQGLIEATNHLLAVVFTSNRQLSEIRPDIFLREELTTFTHQMYLLPAQNQDARTIFKTVQDKYENKYSEQIEDTAIELTGGHMQYLYLVNILLYERLKKQAIQKLTSDAIKTLVLNDEQITLQSEEIFEGLSKLEQETVKNLANGKKITQSKDNKYLFDTGIIIKNSFFSPLFEDYLKKKALNTESVEFSKKEHLLYSHLLNNSEEICERDAIIHAVWPESEETGVSDWTIDRLVARLRHKLGLQKSDHKIVTVKTRGYKLVQS